MIAEFVVLSGRLLLNVKSQTKEEELLIQLFAKQCSQPEHGGIDVTSAGGAWLNFAPASHMIEARARVEGETP